MGEYLYIKVLSEDLELYNTPFWSHSIYVYILQVHYLSFIMKICRLKGKSVGQSDTTINDKLFVTAALGATSLPTYLSLVGTPVIQLL
jgi:hypothetical protein